VAQPIKKAPWRPRRHRLAGTRSGADRAHPAREGAPARFAGHPWLQLPRGSGLRLLEIGCGTAEDAGLWLHKGVHEYVGVDLDETAIAQARSRLPDVTFLCADAARLPSVYAGYFDIVLIRRPDLFARPRNWQQVFGVLPALLRPGGRVLVVLIGQGETMVARRWLEGSGLPVTAQAWQPEAEAGHVLVAEKTGTLEMPARRCYDQG